MSRKQKLNILIMLNVFYALIMLGSILTKNISTLIMTILCMSLEYRLFKANALLDIVDDTLADVNTMIKRKKEKLKEKEQNERDKT